MIEQILDRCIVENSSDIHIILDSKNSIRHKTQIRVEKDIPPVTSEEFDVFMKKILRKNKYQEYQDMINGSSLNAVDYSFHYKGRRFRGNACLASSGISVSLRLLSETIMTIDQLSLPPRFHMLPKLHDGLVLVCGTTGSGKSTTLASVVDEINELYSRHIITIEDPIEYVYTEKKSIIMQREVGAHVPSFADGVVDAMRQDPDVILVGELRDLKTIQSAITAAETGHLVLGTIHTKSVYEAVDRIVDVFPSAQQQQVRVQFASVAKAIIQQSLHKSKKTGKVVPINEILMVDSTISNMIKNQQPQNSIHDYMRTKTENGNMDLVQNCIWHIEKGHLERADITDAILSKENMNLFLSALRSENQQQPAWKTNFNRK